METVRRIDLDRLVAAVGEAGDCKEVTEANDRHGKTVRFSIGVQVGARSAAAETRRKMAVPFTTLQLKYVIERILARLFREAAPPWLLKGGFAMDSSFGRGPGQPRTSTSPSSLR